MPNFVFQNNRRIFEISLIFLFGNFCLQNSIEEL